MGNFSVFLTIVTFLNLFMLLTTLSIEGLGGSISCGYSATNNMIISTQNGNTTSLDVLNDLPESQASGGGFITDIFNTVLSKVKDIPFIGWVITSPFEILTCTGLNAVVVAILGTVWWMLSFFALISYIFWRDG